MHYEVFYYNCSKEDFLEGRENDYETIGFRTRKQALKFYEQHKDDEDKAGWWITKRNKDWEVIEDIII